MVSTCMQGHVEGRSELGVPEHEIVAGDAGVPHGGSVALVEPRDNLAEVLHRGKALATNVPQHCKGDAQIESVLNKDEKLVHGLVGHRCLCVDVGRSADFWVSSNRAGTDQGQRVKLGRAHGGR